MGKAVHGAPIEWPVDWIASCGAVVVHTCACVYICLCTRACVCVCMFVCSLPFLREMGWRLGCPHEPNTCSTADRPGADGIVTHDTKEKIHNWACVTKQVNFVWYKYSDSMGMLLVTRSKSTKNLNTYANALQPSWVFKCEKILCYECALSFSLHLMSIHTGPRHAGKIGSPVAILGMHPFLPGPDQRTQQWPPVAWITMEEFQTYQHFSKLKMLKNLIQQNTASRLHLNKLLKECARSKWHEIRELRTTCIGYQNTNGK